MAEKRLPAKFDLEMHLINRLSGWQVSENLKKHSNDSNVSGNSLSGMVQMLSVIKSRVVARLNCLSKALATGQSALSLVAKFANLSRG